MTSTASTTAAPREWRLAARPTGWPTPEDFELATSVLPELAEGQIRVRNEVLSVDPYMRGRMSAAKSYAAPYVVGEAMTGAAVGVVEQSRAERIKPGDRVLHGWAGARSRSSTHLRPGWSTSRPRRRLLIWVSWA